jgi:hypothetical protein
LTRIKVGRLALTSILKSFATSGSTV